MTERPSAWIDAARLWRRHEALARIGATAAGGVDRPALSTADIDACRLLVDWASSIGLKPSRDAAGNLFLRLQGTDTHAAPVLSGSHLDSQPTGGKYDGVYGVLAALEACEAIVASGVTLRRSVDVVAWMNEEGGRFAPGMMGSAVFAGARTLAEIQDVSDGDGVTVRDALEAAHQAHADIPRRALGGEVFAYLEAHIEQGPILERIGKTIGIVSGIQGKRTFRVTVCGEASHAGTSRRAERRDALMAATSMVQALAHRMHDEQDVVKFTIGRFSVLPNAPSVVPSQVVFSIDLRHPEWRELRELGDAVDAVCQTHAGRCEVRVEELSTACSTEFPLAVRGVLREAADKLGLSHHELISAAGHDARYLSEVCPSGMLFIPCHLGVTHNEAESITMSDAAAGAKVLVEALVELAR